MAKYKINEDFLGFLGDTTKEEYEAVRNLRMQITQLQAELPSEFPNSLHRKINRINRHARSSSELTEAEERQAFKIRDDFLANNPYHPAAVGSNRITALFNEEKARRKTLWVLIITLKEIYNVDENGWEELDEVLEDRGLDSSEVSWQAESFIEDLQSR